ncbi:hypothetical protein ACOJQI_20840 [Bacillus salacetis]
MNIGDKVLFDERIWYVFWIYGNGYLEIKGEFRKVELVEEADIRLL